MSMRVAIVGLAVLVVGLAGCTGQGGSSLGEPPAQITAFNFNFQDLACNNSVPFTFTIRNVGSVMARSVVAQAQGGYKGYSNQVGDIPPGADLTVNAFIEANDRCGVDDHYTILIEVRPSNGPSYRMNGQINI